MKSQFFPSRVFWRLGLAIRLSREFKLRANGLASLGLLSCSATAGVTLQLLACLARVQLLAVCKPRATHEIQSRVPAFLHNLEQFFTLSHTLPLHDSHLNTRLLIAKIQANLARNKTNKMVDKIQPYSFSLNILSRSSLHNVGIRDIYTCICLECEKLVFPKWSWLTAWPRDLIEPRGN